MGGSQGDGRGETPRIVPPPHSRDRPGRGKARGAVAHRSPGRQRRLLRRNGNPGRNRIEKPVNGGHRKQRLSAQIRSQAGPHKQMSLNGWVLLEAGFFEATLIIFSRQIASGNLEKYKCPSTPRRQKHCGDKPAIHLRKLWKIGRQWRSTLVPTRIFTALRAPPRGFAELPQANCCRVEWLS